MDYIVCIVFFLLGFLATFVPMSVYFIRKEETRQQIANEREIMKPIIDAIKNLDK